MSTLVAIGAHHDDIELRSGGTLAKYVKDGWDVVYVIATTTPYYCAWPEERESKTYRTNQEIIELRKDEARQGAKALGIKDVHFFDFKSLYWYPEGSNTLHYFDGDGTPVEEFNYLTEELPGREFIITAANCSGSQKFLCDFLSEKKADIVLTHFPDDHHWEHYATANFVCKSVRQLIKSGTDVKLYAWEQGGMGNLTTSFAPTHYVDISETIDIKCESLMSFISQFSDHNPEPFAVEARKKAKVYGDLVGMEYAEPFMEFQVPAVSHRDVYLPATYSPANAERRL